MKSIRAFMAIGPLALASALAMPAMTAEPGYDPATVCLKLASPCVPARDTELLFAAEAAVTPSTCVSIRNAGYQPKFIRAPNGVPVAVPDCRDTSRPPAVHLAPG